MTIKTVKLRDFLNDRPKAARKNLPMVHTTESSRLISILNKKALLATKCNIFINEKLCYLFVMRPAYKYEVPGEAPYWMLPTVFVMRFQNPPSFKRIYPFDSGAFSRRRLPDYMLTFTRDDFEFGPQIDDANILIETFFGTEKRYWRRQASSDSDFQAKYNLSALHMQIDALNRLYGDRSNNFDDRVACVETQTVKDVPLSPADVLGVVVPDEYMREPSIRQALKEITPNVETYSIQPVSVSMYFSQIYSCVQLIYQRFGLLNE